MRIKLLILPILAATLTLTACHADKAPQLDTHEDTLAWALGENMALSVLELNNHLPIDNDIVRQAFQHALSSGSSTLTDQQMEEAIRQLFAAQQSSTPRPAVKNTETVDKQQQDYFEKLAKENPDVRKHPAGFYYEEVKKGIGRTAVVGDRIRFDYRSYLMFSGEPYDQTYGKRDPITHVVGRPMFEGLIEAMQLMNAGSIYRFYFPYQLAFGTQGSGDIPGYTPFIYEIELHEIL